MVHNTINLHSLLFNYKMSKSLNITNTIDQASHTMSKSVEQENQYVHYKY